MRLKEYLECLYVQGIDRLNLGQIDTIAAYICSNAPTFKELWQLAEEKSIKQVDKLDELSTCFYFNDGSQLEVSGYNFTIR